MIPTATQIEVRIAGLAVTANADATLVTFGLGSCIAVAVWDPVHIVGGMLHYGLPASTINPERAIAEPALFGDTGIPLLFKRMYEHGCVKKDLVVKVAGAAQFGDEDGVFAIGRRNYTLLRKLFWKNGVMIAGEDVFGTDSRTVRLDVATGRTTVRSGGVEREI